MTLSFSAPQPECLVDPDCPSHLACINEKCENPCFTLSCGIGAECKVKNHRAICVCRPGLVGNPHEICEERKLVVVFNGMRVELQLFFFILNTAGCKSDDECPIIEACYNRECLDPCTFEKCGLNAECSVRNHRATCKCRPGYKGNPYERCRQYECLSDPECADYLACRDEKCVDPCGDCSINADCTARNHRAICECRLGYTGNPYGSVCSKSKPQMFLNMAIPPPIYLIFFLLQNSSNTKGRMYNRQRLS